VGRRNAGRKRIAGRYIRVGEAPGTRLTAWLTGAEPQAERPVKPVLGST
jgi:hypothetical protein